MSHLRSGVMPGIREVVLERDLLRLADVDLTGERLEKEAERDLREEVVVRGMDNSGPRGITPVQGVRCRFYTILS